MSVATTTLPLTVPLTLEVAVHPIEGGGYWGEVVQFPGCVAQAESIEGLVEALPRALADYFAAPEKTEEDARELARIQGGPLLEPGPFPRPNRFLAPPGWSDEDDE